MTTFTQIDGKFYRSVPGEKELVQLKPEEMVYILNQANATFTLLQASKALLAAEDKAQANFENESMESFTKSSDELEGTWKMFRTTVGMVDCL